MKAFRAKRCLRAGGGHGAGAEDRTLGRVAARINRELPGARSLMLGTARDVDEMSPPYKEAFIAEDDRWTTSEFWGILKRESRLITPSYYLLASTMNIRPPVRSSRARKSIRSIPGSFRANGVDERLITVLCILLAYPVSYLLATLPLRYSNC